MCLVKNGISLWLYDSHQHLYALSLQVLYSGLQSVCARLVHEGDALHSYNHGLNAIGRHLMHDFVETSDGSEEYRSSKTQDVNVLLHLFCHVGLVFPWGVMVKALVKYSTLILLLSQVACTLHEQYGSYYHANADGCEQVNKYCHEEHDDKDKGIGLWYVCQVLEASEVNDSPSYGNKNTGEDRQRYVFYQ